MADMKTLNINGKSYTIADPDAAHIDDSKVGASAWSSQKISDEIAKISNKIEKSSDELKTNHNAITIECAAAGKHISMTDASDDALRGLKLYGKTTQNGTPTPENPVPLETAGASGVIKTTVVGKNVANISSETIRSGYYTDSNGTDTGANKEFIRAFAVPVLPNTEYTLSSNLEIYSVWFFDGKTPISKERPNGTSVTFTTPENTSFLKISFRNTSGAADTVAFEWAQLEVGTVATAYEPYKGRTLTTSTPNGLHGIDSVKDEIDFASGVHVKRFGLVDMGTLNWSYVTSGSTRFQSTSLVSQIRRFTASEKANIMCTNYVTVTANNVYGGAVGISSIDTSVWVHDPSYTDAETFKAAVSGAMLLYELAEPTETALSAEELAAFAATKTIKSFTQIFNDSDAEMIVSYNADTETFIDNKVAERMPRNANAAAAIVEEKSGEVVSVNDSSDDDIQGLTLYGKTTQFTTTGKNLCPVAEDYTFTTQGNGANNGYETIAKNISLKAGYVTISFDITQGGASSRNTPLFRSGGGTKIYFYAVDNAFTQAGRYERSIQIPEDGYYSLEWWDNCTTVSQTVSKIMLNEGSTATAYEPYTGGIPAPNPDYPQELVSAGASGVINTKVCGGNMLDYEQLKQFSGNILQTTIDNDGYMTITNQTSSNLYPQFVITGYKGKLYANIEIASKTGNVGIYAANAGDDYSSLINTVGTKFFVKEVDGYFRFMVAMASGDTIKFRAIVSADGSTEWTPYKQTQTLTTSTPNGLCGSPIFRDVSNYTDESGKRWVCDEIDFARNMRIQRVYTVMFDGTEKWNRTASGLFHTALVNFPAHKRYTTTSSHFINGGTSGQPDLSVSNSDVVYFKYSKLTTVDEWKDFLAEQYSNGTPVKVMYQLKTPIETPLTEEELTAYATLHTNKPNTTVYNDANAGLKLTYNADPKTYIDNKFAELAAAIVNNT